MQYKTMVLGLLEQRPEMYEQLRQQRTLLATLDRYARELKASHEAWKDRLAQAKPGRDPSQTAGEALELALKDLEDRLPAASPPEERDDPSLEAAIAYLHRRTPPE